jgi:hypothetical protein
MVCHLSNVQECYYKKFLQWNGGTVARWHEIPDATISPCHRLSYQKKLVARWHGSFCHDKTYHLIKNAHEKLDFLALHFDGNRPFLLSESVVIVSFPLM